MGLENIEFIMTYGVPNGEKDPKEEYEKEKQKTLEKLSRYLDDFYEAKDGFNWVTIAIGHDVAIQ